MFTRPWHLRLLPTAGAASILFLLLLAAWLALDPASDLAWLAWNLVLAWIPLGLALVILGGSRRGSPLVLLAGVGAVWLLFLPNAPYLVTDLIHIGDESPAPMALGVAMLATLAVVGVLLFVAAVGAVEQAARTRLGPRSRWLIAACVWLSGVGIYLGRVLRWNSWDVVGDPLGRLDALAAHVSDPATGAAALALTIALGIGLHTAYAAASHLMERPTRADEPVTGS